MEIWNDAVALLARGLVELSVAFGGNLGLAIVVFSLAVRVALLPWTLRLARNAQEQKSKMDALKPELEAINRRHAADPSKRAEATLALYREHGIQPFHPKNLINFGIQLPLMAALSSAIQRGLRAGERFLWIKDLARPDFAVVLGVALLTAIGAALSPNLPKDTRWVSIALPAALTLLFAWKISAGLGLYWAVSSGVGVAQAALLRRRR